MSAGRACEERWAGAGGWVGRGEGVSCRAAPHFVVSRQLLRTTLPLTLSFLSFSSPQSTHRAATQSSWWTGMGWRASATSPRSTPPTLREVGPSGHRSSATQTCCVQAWVGRATRRRSTWWQQAAGLVPGSRNVQERGMAAALRTDSSWSSWRRSTGRRPTNAGHDTCQLPPAVLFTRQPGSFAHRWAASRPSPLLHTRRRCAPAAGGPGPTA